MSAAEPRREGQYDLRVGAALYAPIVGAFGALALPTVAIVFTVPAQGVASRSDVLFSAGLLVIGMLGSLLGAFGFAALGGERDATANLAATSMFTGTAVVVSLASILAALEVLASIYIPDSAILFAWIVAGGGVVGVFLIAMAVADGFTFGPADPDERTEFLKTNWLKTQRHANRWADVLAWISAVPIVAGGLYRSFGARIHPTSTTIYAVIGAGLGLVFLAALLGMVRSSHALDGRQRGLRRVEALGATVPVGLFIGATVVLLP